MIHLFKYLFLRKNQCVCGHSRPKANRITRIAIIAVLSLSISLLSAAILNQNNVAAASSTSIQKVSTTKCPYCGDDTYSLFKCQNKGCSCSTMIGCTNPNIDHNGNPKCLYRYQYKVYCRKCNGEAKKVWP